MVGVTALEHTGRQVVQEFSEKNATLMAAGIAYNAFLSLAPLLVLLFVLVTVAGAGFEQRIVTLTDRWLPGPIAETVGTIFRSGAGSASASVVSILVLLWGTLKMFRGMDTAFSEIYETTGRNSFVDKLNDGVVVVVAIGSAVVATRGVNALFVRFASVVPYLGLATPLILVGGLVAASVPMFYRFPDVEVKWSYVLPGAVFAAVGWAAMQSLFQVYLSVSGGSTTSYFGGVIVLVTWLYASALVLLVGAVINAVLGGHTSGRAGGVGTGASGYETVREVTHSPEAFADYLVDLSAAPIADKEGQRPEDGRQYPTAEVNITVIEQRSTDGDEEEWNVAVRWTATDGDAPEKPRIDDRAR